MGALLWPKLEIGIDKTVEIKPNIFPRNAGKLSLSADAEDSSFSHKLVTLNGAVYAIGFRD